MLDKEILRPEIFPKADVRNDLELRHFKEMKIKFIYLFSIVPLIINFT